MKPIFIFSILFAFSVNTNAQFNKHEKLLGGSFEILILKEKNTNTQGGGGSPFPGYGEEQKEFSISPEFGYAVKKNLSISVFASYSYSKIVVGAGTTTSKGKGFTAGAAVSRYKFFIKGFGLLLRLQGSYSPSWFKTYQGTDVYKNTFYLTNISLNGGAFYRFGKHFSAQMMLGELSYDHLLSHYQGDMDSKKQDRFFAGFYKAINLSAFYIF